MGPDSDRNAMSSSLADVTGTHEFDIFVTNIYLKDAPHPEELLPIIKNLALPRGNNLFVNDGGGEFTDEAPEHGLERRAWGWAATIADYTNDGHLDIIHGSTYTSPNAIPDQPDEFRPPQVWNGTGTSWGKVDGFDIGFEEHNVRGVARVDHDNDGTLDFVTLAHPSSSLPTPGGNSPFLYENQPEGDDSLQLWVRNPDGLDRNAEVCIETDDRVVYREVNARGDLLSQDSPLVHVGTANETVEQVVPV